MPFRGVIMGSIPIGNKRFFLFILRDLKTSFSFGMSANFSIFDRIFGSSFFMATGFHGFHVFIGTCFLSVCFFRLFFYHFTKQHHFGFEAAAWYWHFVDVVWLFLFVSIYWWGCASFWKKRIVCEPLNYLKNFVALIMYLIKNGGIKNLGYFFWFYY